MVVVLPTQRRIGQRIRAARQAAHFTQEELANQIGVSGSAVSQWESGTRGVGVPELENIARVLSVSVQQLVGESPLPAEVEETDETITAVDLDERIRPDVKEHVIDIIRREHRRFRQKK